MSRSPLVPTRVKVTLREQSGTPFRYWTMLEHWSPFQAACLLHGLLPGPIENGVGIAYWDYHPLDEDRARDAHEYESDIDHGANVRTLTAIIARNAKGSRELLPSAIVSWAVEMGQLQPDAELARIFVRRQLWAKQVPEKDCPSDLQSQTSLDQARKEIDALIKERDELNAQLKTTGKHWAEKRERVYASAVCLLANASDRMQCLDSAGRVVAAKLAELVNDKRTYFGLDGGGGEDEGPAHKSIVEYLQKACRGPLPQDRVRPRKIPKTAQKDPPSQP